MSINLEQGIQTLHRELRGKLRLNLQNKIEQFDLMVQARCILDVYERAIEDMKAGKL